MSSRVFLKYAAVVALIVAAGIVVSRFAPDIGLARPSDATRAAVARTVALEQLLAEEPDFQRFSEALRVAQVAHANCPVRNTADGRVLTLVGEALDAYEAYRRAWQADLEGAWDDSLADPAYWEASHPGLDVPGEAPLAPQVVMDAARERGASRADAAFDEVAR